MQLQTPVMKWRYLGVIFITFLCYRSDRQTERERDGGVEEEEKDIFLRTNKVLNPLWLFHKFDPETGERGRERWGVIQFQTCLQAAVHQC